MDVLSFRVRRRVRPPLDRVCIRGSTQTEINLNGYLVYKPHEYTYTYTCVYLYVCEDRENVRRYLLSLKKLTLKGPGYLVSPPSLFAR